MLHVDILKVPFALFHTFAELVAVFHDTAFYHFAEQVVAFTCTLSNTGEHRITVVSLGDVIDEFLNEHSLAHTCTTEQTDFAALGVRLKQVDYLDTCEKDFGRNRQIVEWRSGLMDTTEIIAFKFRKMVNGVTNDIEHAAFDLIACRNRNGVTKILHLYPSAQTVGTLHGNTSDGVFADMLLYFENQGLTVVTLYTESSINGRNGLFAALERNVDNRADDLSHCSKIGAHIY